MQTVVGPSSNSPGGLVAAFLLTLAVLLADLAIAVHGLQAQQVTNVTRVQ